MRIHVIAAALLVVTTSTAPAQDRNLDGLIKDELLAIIKDTSFSDIILRWIHLYRLGR